MSIIHIDTSDPAFQKNIAGASVSWELTDELNHHELCSQLAIHGLGHHPEPCSPASALHRLVATLYQGKDCLVKAGNHPSKGSKRPAYAVLPRNDSDERMAFVEAWSVGLAHREDKSSYLVYSDTAPADSQEEINMLFPTALEQLGRTEQSIWLCAFVKGALKGVPTIGGSGTYFIGPKEVQVWRTLREVLKPFGIRLYEIPAMRTEQALECVIESVKRYTQGALDELNGEFQKYYELQQKLDAGEEGIRKIQQRALDSRLARVNEQLSVVEQYETLFDTKLGELREQLDLLKVGFGQLSIAVD